MKRSILDLLRGDGCIVVNKRLIRVLGLVEAVIYGELVSRFCYFQDRGRLRGGWFYNTIEDLEQGTGASRKYQASAIKRLQEMGIIDMQVKGIPATRHFRLTEEHVEKVMQLLEQDQDTETTQRRPEDLLIESFQGAGATKETTEELREKVRELMKDGQEQASVVFFSR